MGQWIEVASVRAGPLPPGGAARSRGARDTTLPWKGAAGLVPVTQALRHAVQVCSSVPWVSPG